MRTSFVPVTLLFLVIVSLSTSWSSAQDRSSGSWPPKEITRTGRPWVVYMVPQPSLDEGVPVADARNREDAEAIAKAMSEREFREGRFPHPTFVVRGKDDSKSTEESEGIRNLVLPLPGGQQLVVPLSNVDPKPLPTATPPVIDLTGKVGSGEQLTMTAQASVSPGTVDKEGMVNGRRIKRDSKDLLEWNATLANSRTRYGIEQRWRTKASVYKPAGAWSEWHRSFFYENDEHDNEIDCDAEVRKRTAEAVTVKLYDYQYRMLKMADDRMPSLENLVANGSFEDGPIEIYGDEGGEGLSENYGYLPLDKGATDVLGWVVTRGQIDLHANHVKAAKGRRSVDLNGSPGVGGIRQTIKTEKGKKYILKFMFSGHPGTVEADEPEKVLGLDIGNATKTFKFDTTGHTKAKMGWIDMEVAFTATGGKTTIEFYSLSSLDRYCGSCIDDVCVYAAE